MSTILQTLPPANTRRSLGAMTSSKIELTEKTWNPFHGCTLFSPGCANCYAKGMAVRQKGMGNLGYENGFALTLREDRLDYPLRLRRPSLIFMGSMGDLFHRDMPLEFIIRIFDVITQARQHTFMTLTKRSERLRELSQVLRWPPNLWQGVSVETAAYTHRIDDLRVVPAAGRFVSAEPLLGSLGALNLDNIDWIIAGGESAAKPRVMNLDWAREIRDQAAAQGVMFHFKQIGGRNKKATGRLLDGRTWDDRPAFGEMMA